MRKEKYYNAVLNLAENKSLTSISVRDIANYLDISTGALYYQFSNKDDLFNSMFIKYKKEMFDAIKNIDTKEQLLTIYLQYNIRHLRQFKFTYSSELAHFLTKSSKDYSFSIHLELLNILGLNYNSDSHITTIVFGTLRAYLIAPDYMLRCDQEMLVNELCKIIDDYNLKR